MDKNSLRADKPFGSVKNVFLNALFLWRKERASEDLRRILAIEWKISESLGYGSSGLSSDAKIRLIQDLKGIEKKTNQNSNILWLLGINLLTLHEKILVRQ